VDALWLASIGVLLLALLAAAIGPVAIEPWQIPSLLFSHQSDDTARLLQTILLEVRLPRIVLALVAGAGLAVAGAALQALFRNPLAEPGLIGAASGAALAAACALSILPALTAAPAAFGGSLLATGLAWRIGRGHDAARLLLAGVAINALAGGALALLGHLSNDSALRGIMLWALGSLAGANWSQLIWLVPCVGITAWLLWRDARALDALLLGEREAYHLGHDLVALRRRLVTLTALMVALVVSCCGALAFVGLIAPHIARRILGPAHRTLLPGSALVGAATLLCADLLARMATSPSELPLGAVLSLLGAPFFLFLLVRR
jgi:iron complex transport system permease protein